MRKNPGTWGYFTRFGTPLRLMLINIGGSGLCMTGWPRQWLPSFPKWECHEDTLRLFSLKWYHIAFESWVRCMHHPEHSWFELLKSCWLVGYVFCLFFKIILNCFAFLILPLFSLVICEWIHFIPMVVWAMLAKFWLTTTKVSQPLIWKFWLQVREEPQL